VFELAKDLINMRVIKEDKCSQIDLSTAFNFCNRKDGCGYAAMVNCKSMPLVTVIESSRTIAVNVACAFAVEILKPDPLLVDELRRAFLPERTIEEEE